MKKSQNRGNLLLAWFVITVTGGINGPPERPCSYSMSGVLSFWTRPPEQRNPYSTVSSACSSFSLQPSVRRSKVCTPHLPGSGFHWPLRFREADRASHSSFRPRFSYPGRGHLLNAYADYQADTFRPMVQTNPRFVAGVYGPDWDRLVSDQTQFQPRGEY